MEFTVRYDSVLKGYARTFQSRKTRDLRGNTRVMNIGMLITLSVSDGILSKLK